MPNVIMSGDWNNEWDGTRSVAETVSATDFPVTECGVALQAALDSFVHGVHRSNRPASASDLHAVGHLLRQVAEALERGDASIGHLHAASTHMYILAASLSQDMRRWMTSRPAAEAEAECLLRHAIEAALLDLAPLLTGPDLTLPDRARQGEAEAALRLADLLDRSADMLEPDEEWANLAGTIEFALACLGVSKAAERLSCRLDALHMDSLATALTLPRDILDTQVSPTHPAASFWRERGRGMASRVQVLDILGDTESDANSHLRRHYEILVSGVRPLGAKLTADEAWDALSRRFPWMEEANRAVCEAVDASDRVLRLPPLLIVGPTDTGKTAYACALAKLLGLEEHLISFAGAQTAMTLIGSDRGWSMSHPCLAAHVMRDTDSCNPLIIADAIDQSGESQGGSPLIGLVPFVDPLTACRFRDAYLMGKLDASHVNWIMTANNIAALPPALLQKLTLVRPRSIKAADFPAMLTYLGEQRDAPLSDAESQEARVAFERTPTLRSVSSIMTRQTHWTPPARPRPSLVVDKTTVK